MSIVQKEDGNVVDDKKDDTKYDVQPSLYAVVSSAEGQIVETSHQLHRRMNNRQVQLVAIGGSIGTGLFITIGTGLARGGPGSLLLAFLIYSGFLGFVNNCIAEMTVLCPFPGGFIRLAGHFVDDAVGFMVGWNFFIYEALSAAFEITAISTVLQFWSDDIPKWVIPLACVIAYSFLNCLPVKVYGESEFWLSGGKVILVFLLFGFTLVTMCGGNPRHDAYGFRYWNHPGAFAEYRSPGDLGRFEGFLACLWLAPFIIVGPEYISMVSAETKLPRTYIKQAYKTIYARFGIFFIGGALTTGIVVAYNDPSLVAIVTGSGEGGGTAAASPYVIAMDNLRIYGLQHLVNALLVTSIFSAGNTYTYCASRSLHGLALEGRAPRIFRYCTASGIPILCVAATMIFPCLSFLQVSNGTSTVLNWLVNLITGGCFINYGTMCVTYLFFYRACKKQGIDRRKFPYTGYFQPYSAWIGLASMIMVATCYGYSSLSPWDVQSFFIYYAMLILAIITFSGWKVIKRTRFVPAQSADLVWDRPALDEYEAAFVEESSSFFKGIMQYIKGVKQYVKSFRKGGSGAQKV